MDNCVISSHYKSVSDKRSGNQNRRNPYIVPYGKGKQRFQQKNNGGKSHSGGGAHAALKCFKCEVNGHRALECTTLICLNCGKERHTCVECNSVVVTCFNCGDNGHITAQCQKHKKTQDVKVGAKVFALSGAEASKFDNLVRETGPCGVYYEWKHGYRYSNEWVLWHRLSFGHRTLECTTLICLNCGKERHTCVECNSVVVTCFNCGDNGHITAQCQKHKKTQDVKVGAKVFTLSGAEASKFDNLVRGTYFIYDIPLITIIDIGVTHSFISIDCVKRLGLVVSTMNGNMVIDTPTNGSGKETLDDMLIVCKFPYAFPDDITDLPP
ncbi:uncharacterized protein LOC127079973 [Lathyrus oleraceus]|uniref:uncharacterized protein LOC127079973 n=1 Tax=Pisum sativum TaxID=3888 RepID=UPI0021CFF5CD|nr:uncharacterized protein LOC127079973 [Pisum sativum]